MDVVHTNLTRLGGVVDIDTEPGVGTTISIKLPLTLAIIPSLLVAMGHERFAIPQVNLAELARVPAAQVAQRLQRIGTARFLRLRGRLLPLIGLREVLGVDKDSAMARDGAIHLPQQRRRRAARTRGRRRRLSDQIEPGATAAIDSPLFGQWARQWLR